jgi:hypothetical protein
VIRREDHERGEWMAVVARGWGVTEYLHLNWMDDRMEEWMEKVSRPRHPLHIVMFEPRA